MRYQEESRSRDPRHMRWDRVGSTPSAVLSESPPPKAGGVRWFQEVRYLQLPHQRSPLFHERAVLRFIVARRKKPLRVLRKRIARNVKRHELGARVRRHHTKTRQRADHIRAVDR